MLGSFACRFWSSWDSGAADRPRGASGDTETVRTIVRELESLPPERARYLAAFAFILARVANADLEISDDEIRRMEQILREVGHLTEDRPASR